MAASRIYLDNAATSWPKPPEVVTAVEQYMRESGVAVGRGATQRGAELQQVVDRCRLRAARLLGAASPQQIAFAWNGTDALNMALHGLLRTGDHVVTTDTEHNSVLRPLLALRQRIGIEVDYVTPASDGVVSAEMLAAALRPQTRLVVVSHVSNVTGAIQPVGEIIAAAKAVGARTLIDAAQSAGHLPIDVEVLGPDLLACSGHKGLLGPLGTGLLYIAPGREKELDSLRQGGTGTRSEDESQPASLPDKYESGNHNAPGLVGLEAALAWIESQTVVALRRHEQQLTTRLRDGLADVGGVTLYGPESAEARSGVLSFSIAGFDPQEAAAILDSHYGIESRAGLHCAPRMHRALGTFNSGGTVRLSVGAFTTESQVDAAITAIRELAGG
ncbi:MAG: aminotransferase class V-fold PLP-dependent enzyme [Planctomycetaceae bacterium]|nr:aminotransferase class V-fold PLP-dependent enzyme [Planctomycetaceae bacterium]